MLFNPKIIKNIYILSWPAILEQLLIGFATLLDAAMVGRIGAEATAAVGINIAVIWLINGVVIGFSMGFSFLVARSIGEKDFPKLEKILRSSLGFSLFSGICLFFLVALISFKLPVWLGAEAEVIPHARTYMLIISAGMGALPLVTVISGIFRSAGNTKMPFVLSLITNTLNFFGNLLLIFPTRHFAFLGLELRLWGADLGIAGAAISTSACQILLALLLLYKLFTKFAPVKVSLRGSSFFDISIIKTMLKIAVPVAFERIILSSGQVALTVIIASLGTVSLAAHYLTTEIESLLYLPSYGFAFAGLTLIGQSLGAQKRDNAKYYALYLSFIGSAVILLECLPIFVFSEPIMSLFSINSDIIALGNITLKIAAATEIFFSFSIIASGIFRGSGDVKFPLNVSLIGMWMIRLPLAYIFVHFLGWDLISVWIAISLDMIFRFAAIVWRLKSGRWLTVWQEN